MAGQIARILVNFLEVAITSIVFHKGVYPSGAFERRRYMNLVVQKAKHPELENYIHSAVNGLFPFLEKGVVERVAVIFFDSDNSPLERYNFKFQVNQSGGPKVQESDLGFSLRSFLVKLSLSKALARVLPRESYDPILPISILGRIPIVTTLVANDVWYQGSILFVVTNKDCRWEITAFFSPEAQISISNPVEHWIPTDTKQWQKIPLITPLKSMSSEPLSLQLYMEHPSLSEENSDKI